MAERGNDSPKIERSVIALVDVLRRVACRLQAGDLGDDGLWLGQCFFRYFDDACRGLTVGRALGLEPEHASASWWLIERRARRNEALREYARRYLSAGDSPWQHASILAAELRRYERSQWLRDRKLSEVPASYHNTPFELLFYACRASVDDGQRGPPTSAKHLERILTSHCSDNESFRHLEPLAMSNRGRVKCQHELEVDHAVVEQAKISTQRRGRFGRG
jgi:hypothetical protein